MRRYSFLSIFTALGLIASFAALAPAFAQTTDQPGMLYGRGQEQNGGPRMGGQGRGFGGGMMQPSIFGTVTAINGSRLTVDGRTRQKGGTTTSTTTYSVDAENVTIDKAGAKVSLSDVAVGDKVMVAGTINGTSVTATTIRDGIVPRGPGMRGPNGQQNPLIQGNGQPIIGGNVTAVNGSTLTVTNKGNATYTVDASGATIKKGNATASVGNVAVGDSVIVQGTVNGTSVVASTVIDNGAQPVAPTQQGQNNGANAPASRHFGGFFGGIMGFFSHLFGF